jgi:hypothetical protein
MNSLSIILIVVIVILLVALLFIKTRKESFVDASDPDSLPYNTVIGQEQFDEPIDSLDFKKCSVDCCDPLKSSGMSCLRGCVCKSEKNDFLLTSRGGNRTDSHEQF